MDKREDRLKALAKNIRRRFSDNFIFLELDSNTGQLLVKRRNPENKLKPLFIMRIEKDASRDYVLRRLYETDTWGNTWAEHELDKDVTPALINDYETRKTNRELEQHERAFIKRKVY